MRKALIVGIDHYERLSPLYGAVADARAVAGMLRQHADGSRNFEVRLLESTSANAWYDRNQLRDAIRELFAGKGDVAFLYMAGHGHLAVTGGYVCSSECRAGDEGVPMSEIMTLANASAITNKVIVLDCCHGGMLGGTPDLPGRADLSDGVTVLTASTAEQYASEERGSGVFTGLLVDALDGAAANLIGEISPAAIYAHIDQSLGSWSQRPVFKTNVEHFVSLRSTRSALAPADLRRLATLFPQEGHRFPLDPSFEPERAASSSEADALPPPDPRNVEIFGLLQKFNRVGLLVPEQAPHMWHAAMGGTAVRLTPLGEHYRRLAAEGRI